MKKVNIKLWKIGVLTFVPFLGIISPVVFLIIFGVYFLSWMFYLGFRN